MNTKRVSIAVAVSALGLAIAPGVASAADGQVACGTPAKQAVYSTVVVPGTAAVTHEEYEWSSVAEVIEQQWHQWLVDSAAKEAVFETVHHAAEYVTTTVPGVPAYDEQVLDVPAHDEQVLDVAAHDEQVVDVPAHEIQIVDVPAHDIEVIDVAAHDEQVVDVPAHDIQVLDVAAHDEQVVDVPAHDIQVVDVAAHDEQVLTSPAVYATEYLFVNKNGKETWDTDPNWNANNNDKSGGWVSTNQTRPGALVSAAVYTTVHVAATYKTVTVPDTYKTVTVPDTYKTVTVPATYKTVTVPATYKTVTIPATYKTVTVPDTFKTVTIPATYKTVTVPDTFKTVTIPATYKTVTVPDTFKTVHVPDTFKTVHVEATYTTIHHEATYDTTTQVLVSPAWDEQVLVTPAIAEVGHWDEVWSVDSPGEGWSATGETRSVAGETTKLWAATSPGEGWTATGAYRTVEDTPAVPDSSEQVLVSAAVPAGPACDDDKPVTGGGDTVVPEPADPASAVPAAAGLTKPAAVNELAFTGSDPTLLWLGMGFLLAGIGVSAGYRKVAQKR